MAGVPKTRIGHDDVYEATAALEGGVLVIPATGAANAGVQGIAVATDSAKTVLGVASRRAQPTALTASATTDGDGYPVLNVNSVNELVTVYKRCVVRVTYTAAAVNFGVKLAAAANGAVRAWVSGDGADGMVGECRVIGGMAAAGGVGFAYIY